VNPAPERRRRVGIRQIVFDSDDDVKALVTLVLEAAVTCL
jgi:hypothetical protein